MTRSHYAIKILSFISLLNIVATRTDERASFVDEDSLFVDEFNWPDVFTELCYYHELRIEGPDSICRLNDSDIEQWHDQRCTLMDMILATRHYHPRIGRSTWISKYSNEATNNRISIDQTQLYCLLESDVRNQSQAFIEPSLVLPRRDRQNNSSNRFQSNFLLWIKSALTSLPRHQKLGMKGLSSMVFFLMVIIVLGLLKDKSNFSQSLRLAFNYKEHFQSIFKSSQLKQIVGDDRFLFFDGIRVISMLWVISGHAVLYWATFLPFSQSSKMLFEMAKEKSNYPLFASVFAVDNFFYISGFLTGFQLRLYFHDNLQCGSSTRNTHRMRSNCDEEQYLNNHWKIVGAEQSLENETIYSCKPQFNIPILIKTIGLLIPLIIQRYVRLMAVNAFILFGYLSIDWHTMALPAGSRYLQATNVACTEVAPSLLLLINNHMHESFINDCMGWTWYVPHGILSQRGTGDGMG